MMDFMFFVKTFVLTLVIVLLMQIQVGERTLETHAMSFVQSSTIVRPLNLVAKGAAKMARDLTQTISSRLHHSSKKKKDESPSSQSENPD